MLRYGFFASILAVVVGLGSVSGGEGPPKGFISLFNGQDLTGWKATGNPKVWGTENGTIFVSKGGGGYLMTEKEYSDFVLQFEFRMSKVSNSGVALRAPLKGNPSRSAMEIQLIDDLNWKNLKSWQHTGSIYGVVPASKIAIKEPGQWNQMTITCKGPHVKVVLNGETLVDANLKDHEKGHPGLQRTKGHIGFQSYNIRVDFRKIYLKPL